MNLIFNVRKPSGPSSHDVVAMVRRWSRVRRVGHAGTLDPLASGVLIVCTGNATRVIEYMTDHDKEYLARIEFGRATASYDAEGTTVRECDTTAVEEADLELAFKRFLGPIEQAPPAFSAIKVAGKPAYLQARKGKDLHLEKRPVTIHALQLIGWKNPVADIYVRCSKGTYVRSLANDLGDTVCGAGYLKRLVRLSSGPFSLADSVELDQLELGFAGGYADQFGYQADEALTSMPALILDSQRVNELRFGRAIVSKSAGLAARARAFDNDGQLIAVCEREESSALWRPRKVFAA